MLDARGRGGRVGDGWSKGRRGVKKVQDRRPARLNLGLLRWLLAPLWAAEIFTAAKSFKFNPILGSERLNRAGLHSWRSTLAHWMAWRRRERLAGLVSAENREAFDRDGFVARRDFLPPALFAALKAEVEGFHGEAQEMLEGDAVTRHIALTPETLGRLPACRALLDLPEWRGLTSYVASFDQEPVSFIQTIFSHVASAGADPQTTLHMDTFHPTMKAWLFLEEVTDGPVTYVPGSHRPTKRRLAWERAGSVRASSPGAKARGGAFRIERGMLRRLGYPAPVAFTVPANTLVVADTYGFHARGESLAPTARIEIWAYSRPNPFAPWAFDPWPAPLRRRQAGVQQALIGWARRLGLDRTARRSVEVASPASPPEPWS